MSRIDVKLHDAQNATATAKTFEASPGIESFSMVVIQGATGSISMYYYEPGHERAAELVARAINAASEVK